MRHLLFAAAIGMVIGFEPACGGACSHNCCADSHCVCAGSHCCAADPVADPEGHNHCEALRQDFDCTVTWFDAAGTELGTDVLLYEEFSYQQGAVDTCNGREAGTPYAPEGAATAQCACSPTHDAPTELRAPG